MGRRASTANEGFFYIASKDAWVCEGLVAGGGKKRVTLVKGKHNKEAARTAYHKLLAVGGVEAIAKAEAADRAAANASGLTVAALAAKYLAYLAAVEQNVTTPKGQLSSFLRDFGTLQPAKLTPDDVVIWCSKQTTRQGKKWSRNNVVCVKKRLKSFFNWCCDPARKLLPANPLAGMVCGSITGTRQPMSAELIEQIRQAGSPAFVQFFDAFRLTGCRPSALAKVTAGSLTDNGSYIVAAVIGKNFKKKGELDRICFRGEQAVLVRQLAAKYPDGPLFRTDRGHKWEGANWRDHFDRMKTTVNVPDDVAFYSARHTFGTEGIRRGVSTSLLAIAMNTSVTMIDKHYGRPTTADVIAALDAALGEDGQASSR